MPDYPSIAALRSALTSENPDQRGEAYLSVLEHDVQPTAVLGSQPDPDAVQTLIDAGVVPSSPDGTPVRERWGEVVALLETIAENTGGGS